MQHLTIPGFTTNTSLTLSVTHSKFHVIKETHMCSSDILYVIFFINIHNYDLKLPN